MKTLARPISISLCVSLVLFSPGPNSYHALGQVISPTPVPVSGPVAGAGGISITPTPQQNAQALINFLDNTNVFEQMLARRITRFIALPPEVGLENLRALARLPTGNIPAVKAERKVARVLLSFLANPSQNSALRSQLSRQLGEGNISTLESAARVLHRTARVEQSLGAKLDRIRKEFSFVDAADIGNIAAELHRIYDGVEEHPPLVFLGGQNLAIAKSIPVRKQPQAATAVGFDIPAPSISPGRGHKTREDHRGLKTRLAKLIPVERLSRYPNILFRRGDKFVPFEGGPNGTKVRQLVSLFLKYEDAIRNAYGNTVITAANVHSPQGYIVAYVARMFGFQSRIVIGGRSLEKTFEKHPFLRRAGKIPGTSIEIASKVGYPAVLNNYVSKAVARKPAFVINFGMNVDTSPDALLDSVAKQVRALPDDLDNLVIPVGSGLSSAGIIRGLLRYGKRPGKVYLVDIAGHDQRALIDRLVGRKYPYEYVSFDQYKYQRWVPKSIGKYGTGQEVFLDGRYEGKAFEWLIEHSGINTDKKKTLFWIVGNGGEYLPKTAGSSKTDTKQSRQPRVKSVQRSIHRPKQTQLSAEEVRQQLKALSKEPFLKIDYYTRTFAARAKPLESSEFPDALGWKAKTAAQLDQIAARFPMPKGTRGKLRLQLYLLNDPGKKTPHMFFFGVFRTKDGDSVGVFASKVFMDRHGERLGELDHVRFDKESFPVHGIGRSIVSFLDKEVYRPLGIRRELTKADYIGRQLWAKLGYKFLEDYYLKDVGNDFPGSPTMKYWELARANFERFLNLKRHNLRVKDLVIYKAGKSTPLNSLNDLLTPEDFASVRHRNGKKVKIRPLIGETSKGKYVLGEPVELHVGQAFMLADYTAKGDYIISKAGTKFSPYAMPYWNGYREIEAQTTRKARRDELLMVQKGQVLDKRARKKRSAGIREVRLGNGARLLTRLNPKQLKKVRTASGVKTEDNPKGRNYTVTGNDGRLGVEPGLIWVYSHSVFARANLRLHLKTALRNLAEKRKKEGKPLVILDWGAGEGRLAVTLLKELFEEGIIAPGQVKIYAYSDQYFKKWEKVRDVTFILDLPENLPQYFQREGIQVDMIVSYFGLSEMFRRARKHYPEQLTGKHFGELSTILAPDGEIRTTVYKNTVPFGAIRRLGFSCRKISGYGVTFPDMEKGYTAYRFWPAASALKR